MTLSIVVTMLNIQGLGSGDGVICYKHAHTYEGRIAQAVARSESEFSKPDRV